MSHWPLAGLLLLFGIAAWLARKTAARLLAAQQSRRNNPANVAAELLLTACRNNAAAEAYTAGLQWKRAVSLKEVNLDETLPPDLAADFKHEWKMLSQHVYGIELEGPPWTGGHLADIFTDVRRKLGQTSRTREAENNLPALNPTHSPESRPQ